MPMSKTRCLGFVHAAVMILAATTAYAQASRTWVSGVGDDANPCSRTAPCKTFAGAISKTAAGGEISVLDPGGFGAVTITKAITIESDGTVAGVLAAGTNGIVVNAGANDAVVLRGLIIEGLGTGLNGVRFLAGGSLHVENCTINRFTQMGIDFEPSGASRLFVKDTVVRNNGGAAGGGILVKPGLAGSALVAVDHVRLERNQFGLRVEAGARAVVRDSVAAGNTNAGFIAVGASGPAILTLESSTSAGNGTAGVRSDGSSAQVVVSNVHVTGNATGLSVSLGSLVSFGNNFVFGNTVDGSATSTISPQ